MLLSDGLSSRLTFDPGGAEKWPGRLCDEPGEPGNPAPPRDEQEGDNWRRVINTFATKDSGEARGEVVKDRPAVRGRQAGVSLRKAGHSIGTREAASLYSMSAPPGENS